MKRALTILIGMLAFALCSTASARSSLEAAGLVSFATAEATTATPITAETTIGATTGTLTITAAQGPARTVLVKIENALAPSTHTAMTLDVVLTGLNQFGKVVTETIRKTSNTAVHASNPVFDYIFGKIAFQSITSALWKNGNDQIDTSNDNITLLHGPSIGFAPKIRKASDLVRVVKSTEALTGVVSYDSPSSWTISGDTITFVSSPTLSVVVSKAVTQADYTIANGTLNLRYNTFTPADADQATKQSWIFYSRSHLSVRPSTINRNSIVVDTD